MNAHAPEGRNPPGESLHGLSPEARSLFEAMLTEQSSGGSVAPPEPTAPGRYPLSVAQQRLWQLGRFAPGTAWGNLPLCFEVRGAIRPDALGAALRDVVERQSTLRTRYEETDTGVWGRVEPVPGRVLEIDPISVDAVSALRRAKDEARVPLDPATDTLFRARWSPTGVREGILFLLTHHLVTDGWSIGLLLREVSACYAARVQGKAPDLPPIEGSFEAEAAAEAHREIPPSDVAYWRERLDGAPREVPLPGAVGSPDEVYRSAKTFGHIDGATASALRKLAASEGVTPFAALLGALQLVLSLYTGEEDIVVGTTVSVRDRPARERIIGNFGNNLLLRTWVGGDPSPREVLRRIRDTLPRDLAHQNMPLEHLLGEGGGASSAPRLNVLFMLRDGAPDDHLTLLDCETTYRAIDVGASTVDLTLDVFDQGEGGFALAIEHRSARIEAREARALARDFEKVVAAAVSDPDGPGSRLEIRHLCWSKGPLESPAPDDGPARAGQTESDGLITKSEVALAALWRKALGVDSVSAHDNFFELGGHSLLAISVLEQVEEAMDVRLTPVDLVSQTLAQLAATVDAAKAVAVRAGSSDDGTSRSAGRAEGSGGGFFGKLRRRGRGDG